MKLIKLIRCDRYSYLRNHAFSITSLRYQLHYVLRDLPHYRIAHFAINISNVFIIQARESLYFNYLGRNYMHPNFANIIFSTHRV